MMQPSYIPQVNAPGQTAYGSAAGKPVQRHRIATQALCTSLIVPWVFFTLLFALTASYVHYEYDWLYAVLAIAALLVVLVFGYMAYEASRKRLIRATNREPTWKVFFAFSMFVAFVCALWFGELNYVYNIAPYYDVEDMGVYTDVDPSTTAVDEVLDAGLVTFVDGTVVNTSLAIGFKDSSIYCVAPIVYGDAEASSYDYWAVGLDCCTAGANSTYECGAYMSDNATGGIRATLAAQLPFYLLAAQDAAATNDLSMKSPIFFYWVEDAADGLHSYLMDGLTNFLFGSTAYFFFQFVLVVLVLIIAHTFKI